jgi:hypothetical protein
MVHDVSIGDCSQAPDTQRNDCLTANNALEAQSFQGLQRTVTVMKSFGLASFTAGGGTTFSVADQQAIVLELNVMALLPAGGVVLEPSLGYRIGI